MAKKKRYGLLIAGRKRAIYFKSIKERNKITKLLKGKVTYSTFHEEK